MRNKYIILDTETIGIPHRNYGKFHYYKISKSYDNARLVQLSFYFTNFCENENINIENKIHNYIVQRKHFEIENSHIHGITNQISDTHGLSIDIVLNEFIDFMKKNQVEIIIAHNMEFDINIIKNELYRLEKFEEIKYIESLKLFCSMQNTTNILKIKNIFNNNNYKWPNLKELYFFATGKTDMENTHNSMYDVLYLYESIHALIDKKLICI